MSSEVLISPKRKYVTRTSGRANTTLISRNLRGYVSRFIRPMAGAKNEATGFIWITGSLARGVPGARRPFGPRALRARAVLAMLGTLPTAKVSRSATTMRQSTDRFVTTHTGSLPRPDDLIQIMFAKEEGLPIERDALAA